MTQEIAAPADFLGLKTRREALRLTLKDICQSTRVSVVNLEAIENGEFHELPVPIYTKNFIKTYARALDVDSKPILDSYEAYLDSLKIDETPMPAAVPEEKQEPFINRLVPYKKYIATGAIIFIAAVVTLVILKKSPPQPQVAVGQPAIVATVPPAAVIAPVNPPEQAVPVTPPAPAAPPKAVAKPVVAAAVKQMPQSLPPQPQQKSATPLKPSVPENTPVVEKKAPVLSSEGTDSLVIKATEATWLRMKIDQNPPFQVLLKPGEAIERKGAGFTVDVGNAGGIIMQFKGKTIENLGKSGEVVHLQLP